MPWLSERSNWNVIIWNFRKRNPSLLKKWITAVKDKISSVIDRWLNTPQSIISRVNERLSFRAYRVMRSMTVSSISWDTIKLCDLIKDSLDDRVSFMSSPHFNWMRYDAYVEELRLWKRTVENELLFIERQMTEDLNYWFSTDEKVLFLNILFHASLFKKKLINKRSMIEWLKKDIDTLIDVLENTPQLSTSLSNVYKLSAMVESITNKGIGEISHNDIVQLEEMAVRIRM